MPRLDPTWRTASYAAAVVNSCILEIDAEGTSGVGGLAARPPGKGAQAEELTEQIAGPVRQLLVGADAWERRDLLERLKAAQTHRSIISAVDMALYDLLGKSAGLP